MTRRLIVNADDFGQSDGINRGVVAAAERGPVRSASLMVRWPAAKPAAEYAASRTDFSLGLHFDLGEWAFTEGEWVPVYQVVGEGDADAVRRELAAQLARFEALAGRHPTHIDSHQHVHRREPVRSIVLAAAADLDVPVRSFDHRVRYEGGFYGQFGEGQQYPEGITLDHLLSILRTLPDGITELGCHPGDGSRDVHSMYLTERADELRVLQDERVMAEIRRQRIELCSFRTLSLP